MLFRSAPLGTPSNRTGCRSINPYDNDHSHDDHDHDYRAYALYHPSIHSPTHSLASSSPYHRTILVSLLQTKPSRTPVTMLMLRPPSLWASMQYFDLASHSMALCSLMPYVSFGPSNPRQPIFDSLAHSLTHAAVFRFETRPSWASLVSFNSYRTATASPSMMLSTFATKPTKPCSSVAGPRSVVLI